MAKRISASTEELGRRVRALRIDLELTQEELAERTQLHWTYIGSVERGQRNISLLNICRLAKALEVDAGELVTGLKPWRKK